MKDDTVKIINPDLVPGFIVYKENLIAWNKVMNLTTITESEEIDNLHFKDSLALLEFADFKGKKVIDVGTGAGFPGLPLRLKENSINLTLLDSLDKRLSFLKDTCEKLELNDVKLVHARAEEIPNGYRENFDIAVSRAVARLRMLAELCLPYVKPGGLFIAMKGPDFDAELEEAKDIIKALGAKTEKCFIYEIGDTGIRHSAIIIRKFTPTDRKYPRRWAQIKKEGGVNKPNR